MDEEVHEVLNIISPKNVELLKISDVETEELKSVKSSRTKGEYCWTITLLFPNSFLMLMHLFTRDLFGRRSMVS